MSLCPIIAVDFDGTIVEHAYPDIGAPVPGALDWMKRWQEAGAQLILWTMRSDTEIQGPALADVVEYCKASGVEFWGVNENPDQKSWTTSRKAYANLYVDDTAFGCPLHESARMGGRPYVDWKVVGPAVLRMITGKD